MKSYKLINKNTSKRIMHLAKYIILTVICVVVFSRAQSEFLIDTNTIYTPAAMGQKYPSIAFDGSNYFTVWIDSRGGITGDSLHLYGCRLTPEGILIDSAGIPISIVTHEVAWVPESPAIAYCDSMYLVVWADYRNWDWDIYGARIDINGNVLDPDGFVISSIPWCYQYYPSVIFGNTNFLVVWYEGAGVFGCRVTPDGQILDPNGFPVSTNSDCQLAPSVSFDGINYFVVWQDATSIGVYDIFGIRIDTAGNALDTTDIHVSAADNSQENPSIEFDGTNYLVTWQDSRWGQFDIYGARVDTSGLVLDSAGVIISNALNWQEHPAVAFNGTNFIVTWLDWRDNQPDIYCARLDTSGLLLDSTGIFISNGVNDLYCPGVASDGNNCLIAWPDDRSWRSHIYGARIDTAGTLLDPEGILLSTALYSQWFSSGAFDGTNYFVVWQDYRRDEYSNIFGARIDTTGTVLESSGIAICTTSYSYSPAIAYDGLNYLAVWLGISGTRIDTSGVLLDSNFIDIGNGFDPSICFDGINYFVVFRRNIDIYGARISTSGIVLDSAGFRVSPMNDVEKYPAVDFDGTNYLVVWQDNRSEWMELSDIYGTFVDTAGNVLDTLGFPISVLFNIEQAHPSVAFDRTNYFVVWQDGRNDYADIYGARVTQTGVVLDTSGILICGAPSAQYKPQVAFDGTYYCIVWEDWRGGNYSDIYGCHVDVSGSVINTFIVSTRVNNQLCPYLTKGSNKFLITYTGFIDTVNNYPANTMRIWGEFHPFVGVEENFILNKRITKQDLQVYPNPVRKQCKIQYVLTQEGKVKISIYDVTGRLIGEIINEDQDIGVYQRAFEMTNLSQGIYFLRYETDNYSQTKKIILIK
ncbi:MAG: T9SS type A sorting domain-containing protein [bacterium]